MNAAQDRSVKNLQELYTVAVGVALATAIARIVDTGAGQFPFRARALPVFFALLAILVPFYHGTMRHLDVTYVEEGGRGVLRGALLADFFLLFLEACLLFAAAQLLDRTWYAGWVIAIALVFDALWGIVVHMALSRVRRWTKQSAWILINLIFGPTLMILLVVTEDSRPDGNLSLTAAVVFMSLAIVRTAIDYTVSWNFYYPGWGGPATAPKEPEHEPPAAVAG